MAQKPEKKAVIAVAEIQHGPDREKDTVKPGHPAEFAAEVAQELVDRGMARWPGSDPVTAAQAIPQPPAKEADRLAVIAEAIAKLDKDEDFNAKGVPSLDALARVLGWRPSIEDRDKGFDKAKAGNPDLFK